MQVSYCDICGVMIKEGDEKYLMLVQKVIEIQKPEEPKNYLELRRVLEEKYEQIKTKEICKTCKQIHDYIFKLKKDNIDKIKKHLEKSFKKTYEQSKKAKKTITIDGYCNCEKFQDEGITICGIANGICYICGKYAQRPLIPDRLKKLLDMEGEDEKV